MDKESLLNVACIFAGFHATKRKAPDWAINADPISLQQMQANFKIYADAYWLEASDNGAKALRFRPPVTFAEDMMSYSSNEQMPSVGFWPSTCTDLCQ